ncbi:zinc transporter [Coxiella burnetii]|uniref:ZIP family zinc transporter n=1 Tax=Coxiella burnetii (strain Dugway 5J108-111) TaxID=434922 RepID=A9KF92_COXBN|nr:ZIP family metal transporter [Coxiella burnetii]ABS76852.1 ZIP family zinc transporter [Coxiella burnetii Dugway 5J108-111]OYK80805.1 zinc transporter [Coxiella burnetii]OYK82893.1 zinc transporter [Coxiella burnetii]
MSLFAFKGLIAVIIALVTVITGLASLRFIHRYQHLLSLGDAFADGIFLGAAAFHLFPDAIESFPAGFSTLTSYLLAILLVISGFFLLFVLERTIIHQEKERHELTNEHTCKASAWMLIGILSVHAFIAGAALGISDTLRTVSILLIAILAHKGFESFALMMGLHRNLKQDVQVKNILWAFTFVTPLGIILAAFIESFLHTQAADIITGLFSAFAAGSFLYIGTLHGGHNHFHAPRDPTKRYEKIIATLLGIAAMGIVAIWA